MNDDRDRTEAPKRHRLAWSSALAVVVMALSAPLAGAAGVEVPQAPALPQLPEPALPVEQLPVPDAPDLPEVDPPVVVPDVTTLPVPVEELEGAVDPVTDVVDGATGGVGDVVDGVGDVVDETAGKVDDVVDEVTDPDGPVGGAIDEVTDPDGPVGGVVDEVTDPEGPVGDVVDEVTDPDGPVGGVVDEVTGGVGSATDKVEGVLGTLPDVPDVPGTGVAGPGELDPGVGVGTGGGPFGRTPSEIAVRNTKLVVPSVSTDGFAASVLAARESAPAARDLPAPSFVERIARSVSEIAQKIAFPLLLALVVGAFVVVQNRVDRKDPKLALAAIDADEDLLSFE